MRLIFVLENFDLGGVERVTLQLLKALLARPEHDILLLCQQNTGVMSAAYAELARIVEFDSGFIRFRTQVMAFKPDLIIYTKGGLCRFGLALPGRFKSLVVQHVPIMLPHTSVFKNVLRKYAATLLYRFVDKVICVSDGIKDDLISKKVLPAAKVTRIYNPVLDDTVLQLANQPQSQYQDYFVCVGRLHYQKGYDYLLDIVSRVKHSGYSIKVVILGDGPERDALAARIAELGLSGNIVLHGSESNPYKYIRAAKAILLPSRWEGLPTVLVEAAALNTPIVAFDCHFGPKELTADGVHGYLVAPADTMAFADCVTAVINGARPPAADISDFFVDKAAEHYLAEFALLLR